MMHQITVLESSVSCSCGYSDDNMTPEQVLTVSDIHAKTNRPSVIEYRYEGQKHTRIVL